MDTRGTLLGLRSRAGRLLMAGGLAGTLVVASQAALAPTAGAEPTPVEPPRVVAEQTTPVVAERSAGGVRVYPVPTSDSGVGRIVTAPNGDMWFTMEDANKIGRITPQGRITQFVVDELDDIGGGIPDLDVDGNGIVWVIWDHGRSAFSFRPSDQQVTGAYDLYGYPYGEEVEIGPGGIPWISMAFDEEGLARIVNGQALWYENAPPCDGALARARDGAMWCQSGDQIIKSTADASGGTTYPLPPSGATYPYSLSAGPTGSIWFARYFSGTWISAPDDGNVGWLDARSGRTRIFQTGEDTAPFSLTMGPDRKMWFTSIGDAAGIGHIDARGRGALTKIGNYEPRYLTFAKNGDVWFTDSTNNAIVRVPRSALKYTNVDPGDGSVFTVAAPLGTIAAGGKPLVVKRDRVPVRVACPKGGGACRGKVVLTHPKKGKAWTKTASYKVKAGKKATLNLTLTKAGKKAIKRKPTKARVALSGQGRDASKQVKVRR